MEEKIIPAGKFIPYTLNDLSVVIPQASQYVKRLKWFIPQYIKATPKEVVDNTIVVYDPEDTETKSLLDSYNIKGITVAPPHSTYKLQAGFAVVKTRLCTRIHNDAVIKRSDWAQVLIDKFNNNKSAQLIGALNFSGALSEESIKNLEDWYPGIIPVYQNLAFSGGDRSVIGAPFFGSFLMAAQSYIFKGIYSLIVDFNEGRMDKEDVFMTIFASIFNVKLINWTNMYSFVANAGAGYGDFEDDVNLPNEQYIVTEENKLHFPQAEFKEYSEWE